MVAPGYPGVRTHVARWMSLDRHAPAPTDPTASCHRTGDRSDPTIGPASTRSAVAPVPGLPAARHLVWLLLRRSADLDSEEQATVGRLTQHRDVARAHELARAFQAMVRQRQPERLDGWLRACQESEILELQSFATGLQREEASIRAALREPWSNGQTEGQVTRLKLVKRQMYGRAKFDLLRQRVLQRE